MCSKYALKSIQTLLYYFLSFLLSLSFQNFKMLDFDAYIHIGMDIITLEMHYPCELRSQGTEPSDCSPDVSQRE
jgi:hypothetical protein